MIPREHHQYALVLPWRMAGRLTRLYTEIAWMWDFQYPPYKENGIADLEKAKHYIELLIELESRDART